MASQDPSSTQPSLFSNAVGKGAVYLLAGEGLLALMAALIKWQSDQLSVWVMVFCRCLFGLLAIAPLLIYSRTSPATQVLHWHCLRAMTGILGMYGYFYVLAHITLPEATLVKLTSPFFLPLIAFVWLKERISAMTLVAIALGFLGIALILQPGTAHFAPAALVGVLAAFFASCAKVTIRRMSVTEPSLRIVFYFALLTTLFSSIGAMREWPELATLPWLSLILLGMLGTGGQILMTQAYRLASPGQVGVYTYSSVIYASVLGWFVWGERLNALACVGAFMVVGAGIINLVSRNQLRRQDIAS